MSRRALVFKMQIARGNAPVLTLPEIISLTSAYLQAAAGFLLRRLGHRHELREKDWARAGLDL